MQPILVTGGGGTLGRAVVRRLFDLGQPVRGLTRQESRPGPAEWFTGDLTTGAGLERAVEGARLVELAAGRPRGRAPDLGGPEAREMGDMARTYLRAAGRRRPVLALPVLGRAARAVRDGALLVPGRAGGRRTWDAFLAERLAVAPAGAAR